MTEQEWLTATDPEAMIRFLDSTGSFTERKARLFAVATGRRFSPLLRDPRPGDALDVAERFADGLASNDERSAARKAAQQAAQPRGVVARPDAPKWERRAASLAYYAAARSGREAAWNAPSLASEIPVWRAGGYDGCDVLAIDSEEKALSSNLLREIFGPLPFRGAPDLSTALGLDDGTVKRLAQAAYEERSPPSLLLDPARLAVLSDALEEADCPDAAILAHLRSAGPHVRGCWALDVVFGK